MRQADRGTYEKDSYSKELGRSCLFKIFKLGGVIILLLIIAILTVPTEKRMKKGAFDAVVLCILGDLVGEQDRADDFARNMSSMVTRLDSTSNNIEQVVTFSKLNTMEVYNHLFYSTLYIHNSARPQGVRAAIGIFGLFIPTVGSNDFLLNIEPMQFENRNRILGRPVEPGEAPQSDPLDYDDDYNPYEIGH